MNVGKAEEMKKELKDEDDEEVDEEGNEVDEDDKQGLVLFGDLVMENNRNHKHPSGTSFQMKRIVY